MDVDYLTAEIRSLCMESRKATRILGADSAKKLRNRLADLEAARNVAELLAGRPHPYRGQMEKRFSLDLAGGKRLLFVPTKDPPPTKADRSIDWTAVAAVTIVFLGDNHDD